MCALVCCVSGCALFHHVCLYVYVCVQHTHARTQQTCLRKPSTVSDFNRLVMSIAAGIPCASSANRLSYYVQVQRCQPLQRYPPITSSYHLQQRLLKVASSAQPCQILLPGPRPTRRLSWLRFQPRSVIACWPTPSPPARSSRRLSPAMLHDIRLA